MTFREIPPDDRGYPGFTSLDVGEGRAVACLGAGEEAREALSRAVALRGGDKVVETV
jgi:hypothetical protein